LLQLIQDLRSGRVEVVELPDPVARRGEVLVSTAWSVISAGTEQALSSTASRSLVGKAMERPDQARQVLDKALNDGMASALAAVRARLDDVLTPGYSSSGVVRGVGPDVDGLRIGDRVGCFGANHACHAGQVAMPAPLCLKLPDALDQRWGAFGALGGVAAHGLRVGGVEAGAVVAVIGLGLVGQIAAQLATAAGARVVGIDPDAQRVALARRLGAAVGARLEDGEEAVSHASEGAGADAVIITAASSDSRPIELAASLARDRATVSVVGDVGLDVPRAAFYAKELQLRVSRSYGPGRYDPAYEEEGHDYPIGYVRWTQRRLIAYFFEEVAAERVRLEELLSHEFSIERGVEAYSALSEPGRLAIMLSYGSPPEPSAVLRRTPISVPVSGSVRQGLRVGIIGPGLFARSTLLPLMAKLGADLTAVASRSSARAFGVGRRFGASYAAASAEELIADPSIDVVVIATRHDSHAELAARALEQGKGVFLEKPLAIDRAGLERIRPLLESGGRLVVDFNRGFAPATRRIEALMAGGDEPLYIGYRVNAGFLDAGHWLRDLQQGGGRLVGEGCHFLDLCSQLVAAPLVWGQVTPFGSSGRVLPGDSFVITLRYADGSVATVSHLSRGHPRLPKERVEVIGRGRSAVLDDFRRLELHGGPRRRPGPRRPLPSQDKGHEHILREALRFFAHGGSPPVPYERMLATTEATLEARTALERGDGVPFSVRG